MTRRKTPTKRNRDHVITLEEQAGTRSRWSSEGTPYWWRTTTATELHANGALSLALHRLLWLALSDMTQRAGPYLNGVLEAQLQRGGSVGEQREHMNLFARCDILTTWQPLHT